MGLYESTSYGCCFNVLESCELSDSDVDYNKSEIWVGYNQPEKMRSNFRTNEIYNFY